MMYSVFHFLMRIAAYLYYKKYDICKLKLPKNQAVIIISNHGNSFMDAILIAIALKRKIHFLTRADVFNKPWKRWFLRNINMMPVYRIRDGREALLNNNLIFEKCRSVLA